MKADMEHSSADWDLGRDIDTQDDPLMDCLMLLSKLMGKPTTRTALRAGLPLDGNRLSVELFPRAANRANLSTRIINRSLDNISNLELPAVLLLKSGGACILAKVDDSGKSMKLLLPESDMGEQEISHGELQELYTGYAIFVRPKYDPDQKVLSEIEELPRSWFWGSLFTSWRIYRDFIIS